MDLTSLVDVRALALVCGGTLLATLLRSGLGECRITVRVLARLWRRRFDANMIRSELARQVREIQQDGLVRANPHQFGDSEFDEATGAMIEARSVDAMLAMHEHHRARRTGAAGAASRTLAQSAELAPVFGLAGTLVSLSQLPSSGLAAGQFAGAISLAVLTTLYGLLLANLLLAPLSRAVERAIAREEEEREKLFDWLSAQIAPADDREPHAKDAQAIVPETAEVA